MGAKRTISIVCRRSHLYHRWSIDFLICRDFEQVSSSIVLVDRSRKTIRPDRNFVDSKARATLLEQRVGVENADSPVEKYLALGTSVVSHNCSHHRIHRLPDRFPEGHRRRRCVALVVRAIFSVLRFFYRLESSNQRGNETKTYRLCSIFHSFNSFINGLSTTEEAEAPNE